MDTTRSLRLTATVIVAFAALPLSGCLAAQIPSEPQTNVEPSAAPEPTEPSSDLPATLSFADGALLPESAYIEWGDSLMTDDGWEIAGADDGNGNWSYATTDGTCTAQFWQGFTSDVQTTPGDDSASSDAILATLLQTDAASVTPHATDGAFSYQTGGNADVEQRQITGEQDGRVWIMAARAFTATGAGVTLIVDCAGGDAQAVFAEVVDKNAIMAY
ncbi:hypothetical protein [Microbacterium sp.]|uniref:hypothetical protein n=1 Tax=Microbacterium sp. TaxID=51671 RepID=UPI003F9A8708